MLKFIRIIFLISVAGPIIIAVVTFSIIAFAMTGIESSNPINTIFIPYLVRADLFAIVPVSIIGGLFSMIVSVRYGRKAFSHGAAALFLGILTYLLLVFSGMLLAV